MTQDTISLDRAIASVYAAPLDDFVRSRDSLAKELRTSGEKNAAATVKALRKPSRTAWALNLGALQAHDALQPLIAAVAQILEAQAAGGDVRAAIGNLRATVREFAGQASHTAERSGHSVEPGLLSNAILAVLSTPDSFSMMCAGRLVDVPDAGGLDFMASLPAPRVTPVALAKPTEPSSPDASTSHKKKTDDRATRAAARLFQEARVRSENAQHALAEAESHARTTALQLRNAEEDARSAQVTLDRAREEVATAAALLADAETAVTRAGK